VLSIKVKNYKYEFSDDKFGLWSPKEREKKVLVFSKPSIKFIRQVAEPIDTLAKVSIT
jgi:hypothetical protein